MNEKATIIARVESALTHALDELERAKSRYVLDLADLSEINHLEGHVAGLKQALNLCKEPT